MPGVSPPGARGHPGRSLSSSDHPGAPGSWTRVPGLLRLLLSAPCGCLGLCGVFLCWLRVPGPLLSGCPGWRLCATATFFLGVFIPPLLPPPTLILLQAFPPTIVELLELAISQSLHGFLLVLGGKERGNLDPYFYQSISPLCEGNPLDLDLGVLGVLLLVLPLIFLHSFRCFGGIWE